MHILDHFILVLDFSVHGNEHGNKHENELPYSKKRKVFNQLHDIFSVRIPFLGFR